mgnify:CR=1 FL=1
MSDTGIPDDLRDAVARTVTVSRLLVSSDYDGCIAPIVSRPQDAKPNEASISAIRAAGALRDTEAPTSPTDARRKITVCVKAVAGLLGNTPTVCRASYVHPKVFALFESGEIAKVLPGSETKGFEKALIKHLLAA